MRSELITGAMLGGCWIMFGGLWTIGIAVGTAVLWRAGGSDDYPKIVRRLGVPALIGISLYLITGQSLILWSILPAFGIASIGYGIPTWHTNGALEDEGSTIGAFIYHKIVRGKQAHASVPGVQEDLRTSDLILRTSLNVTFTLCFLPLVSVQPAYFLIAIGIVLFGSVYLHGDI